MHQTGHLEPADTEGEKWVRAMVIILAALLAVYLAGVAVVRISEAVDARSTVVPPKTQPIPAVGALPMPEAMKQVVLGSLPPRVEPSAPGAVEPFDESGQPVSPHDAHGWIARYAVSQTHSITVTADYSLSDVEGNPATCTDGQKVDCSRILSGGQVGIRTILPVVPDPDQHGTWLEASIGTPPDELSWVRGLEVQRGGTFVVHVMERVKAPSRAVAQRRWTLTQGVMLRIATDPRLVFPYSAA